MRLQKYIEQYVEGNQSEFARRSGVPRTTIRDILEGAGTGSAHAATIIKATGGLVGIEDLVPAEPEWKRGAA